MRSLQNKSAPSGKTKHRLSVPSDANERHIGEPEHIFWLAFFFESLYYINDIIKIHVHLQEGDGKENCAGTMIPNRLRTYPAAVSAVLYNNRNITSQIFIKLYFKQFKNAFLYCKWQLTCKTSGWRSSRLPRRRRPRTKTRHWCRQATRC
jgi:hypothetical protein